MKTLRKFLLILTALCLIFSFGACGTYTPPSEGGSGGTVTPPEEDNPDNPETPDTPAEDSFTVTLLWNNENFTEKNVDLLQAQWTDKETNQKYRANFNSEGVASITGLDGDYQVTLVTKPDGFTYNPNIYSVNNTFRSVSIDLYQLTPTKGTGADKYNTIITITKPGAYRVTLQSADQIIWFKVRPTERGVYSIESLVDVTANKINPILDRYSGTDSWISEKPIETIDGGGAENTFTKNFRWELELEQGSVSAAFPFVIRSTNTDPSAYPLVVDFIYDKDGDFTGGTQPAVPVYPEEDFSKWGDGNAQDITPDGTFTYCADRPGISNHLLDESMVRLNPADGYYHYYDAVTGEYGDLLFAKISKPTAIVDLPFTDTTYMNIYYLNGRSYLSFINDYYALYVNDDGCYPVTEELKAFLMDYSTSQAIFNDGDGIAEEAGYNSDEESQWMFACGYYAS